MPNFLPFTAGPSKVGLEEVLVSHEIVFFSGCWANYYAPEIGMAFVRVMEKNGFRTLLPWQKCCGMPMMANGNIRGAERNFRFNVKSLYKAAFPNRPIITTCPSCNIMLRREGQKFFASKEGSWVSEHIVDADEFIVRLHREGKLDTHFQKMSLKVFYQNPCHLKVQGLIKEPLDLLKLILGTEIAGINYYCCGLSGSYGMKKANYDRSIEIAQKVWKEAKKSRAEAVVTECGGCGLMIQGGTGLKIFHPMVILGHAYSAAIVRDTAG
jgi:glycerol-3-phosphate dehydrogenase subunit C